MEENHTTVNDSLNADRAAADVAERERLAAVHPETNVFGQQSTPHTGLPAPNPPMAAQNQGQSKPVEKTEPKTPKVDHLGEIAELARSLHNITPSGAETVRDKILQCITDIQDPKAYDERVAKEKKAADESAAASKKAKEEAKALSKAEKVYVAEKAA